MGLFPEVYKAAQAVTAHTKSIEITGSNIAGAGDPDNARKIVHIGTLGTYMDSMGPATLGVGVISIDHARNAIVDQQIVDGEKKLGTLNAQYKYGSQIEAYFESNIKDALDISDTNEGAGISRAIDDFFNSFHNLSAMPTDANMKNEVYQKADFLVDQFNTIDSQLTDIHTNLKRQVDQDVEAANDLLDRIAKMNSQISAIELGSDKKALDLRDQRQGVFEELAKYMSYEVKYLDTTAYNIQIVSKNLSNADVVLVDRMNTLNKLSYDGTNIQTVGTATENLDLTGGSIHGARYIRDTTITNLKGNFDALVQQFVTSVNSVYNPTTLTGNFFDATGLTASTFALNGSLTAVNLKTTDTASSGANELAIAVAELDRKVFSTGGGDFFNGTFSNRFADVVSGVGQYVGNLKTDIITESTVQDSVKAERYESSSVSLNEEVANLMQYQKIIQMLAHYLKITGEILDYLTFK